MMDLEVKWPKSRILKRRDWPIFFELAAPQKKILKAKSLNFQNLVPGLKKMEKIDRYKISAQHFGIGVPLRA